MLIHGEYNGKGQLLCAGLPLQKQHIADIRGHGCGSAAGTGL
jgi:hypothetical protein